MTAPLFCRASGLGSLFAMFEAEQGAEALKRLRLQTGFRREGPAPSALVPFVLMNRVFNLAAQMNGDRQFGARVGQNIRLEDFGPFVEYALQGENLRQLVARSIAAQPLHSSELVMDLQVGGARAIWRLRYRARSEPTVEHHAQRSLMQMMGAVLSYAGARRSQIEIHVAEPHAAEARLLQSRIDIAVRPRASDYAISFPASWLDHWTPVAGLSPALSIEELAPYRDRPLPKKTAEAVLLALELHDDLPQNGVNAIAAELGLPRRTLQHALRLEGASYREIVRGLRLRRATRLLATTDMPLAELALRTGYTDPSNFSRAFQSMFGVTPGQFRATARMGASIG